MAPFQEPGLGVFSIGIDPFRLPDFDNRGNLKPYLGVFKPHAHYPAHPFPGLFTARLRHAHPGLSLIHI